LSEDIKPILAAWTPKWPSPPMPRMAATSYRNRDRPLP